MKISGAWFNIPNFFSYLRIILIPLFIYLLTIKTVESWTLAVAVFMVAAFTDFLDGWTARLLNQESEFGKFIDPFADKVLVISAVTAIIVLDKNFEVFDSWMIVIIVGRDVLITVMRMLALKRGRSLRTSRFGKFKTAFQMMSIVIIIMIYVVRKKGIYPAPESAPYWVMLSVTILTALSGIRYIMTNWRLFLPERKKTEESQER